MNRRLLQLAFAALVCAAPAFATDPDASTVVTVATTAFGSAAVLGIAILGYRKVAGIVSKIVK